jgi:hypothetical protein
LIQLCDRAFSFLESGVNRRVDCRHCKPQDRPLTHLCSTRLLPGNTCGWVGLPAAISYQIAFVSKPCSYGIYEEFNIIRSIASITIFSSHPSSLPLHTGCSVHPRTLKTLGFTPPALCRPRRQLCRLMRSLCRPKLVKAQGRSRKMNQNC